MHLWEQYTRCGPVCDGGFTGTLPPHTGHVVSAASATACIEPRIGQPLRTLGPFDVICSGRVNDNFVAACWNLCRLAITSGTPATSAERHSAWNADLYSDSANRRSSTCATSPHHALAAPDIATISAFVLKQRMQTDWKLRMWHSLSGQPAHRRRAESSSPRIGLSLCEQARLLMAAGARSAALFGPTTGKCACVACTAPEMHAIHALGSIVVLT